MLREELGLNDPEQLEGEQSGELTGELTQRHLVQRLFRIENTVELIQASLLEAAAAVLAEDVHSITPACP